MFLLKENSSQITGLTFILFTTFCLQLEYYFQAILGVTYFIYSQLLLIINKKKVNHTIDENYEQKLFLM